MKLLISLPINEDFLLESMFKMVQKIEFSILPKLIFSSKDIVLKGSWDKVIREALDNSCPWTAGVIKKTSAKNKKRIVLMDFLEYFKKSKVVFIMRYKLVKEII